MKKLAIIVTHPIQYFTPTFKALSQKCKLRVFYTWGSEGIKSKYDPGFRKNIEWDLPLLDDYEYELLKNISKNPGSHHGKGIVNPDIISKIESFAPNAILVYGYTYRSHFKAMQYFKGKIPIWFRGDSTLLDEKPGLKIFLKKLYLKWVYSYIDIAFYVGTNNKAYFKKFGIKENQLIFAPHAIDNDRFAENRQEEACSLRKKLAIRSNDVLILFAGKLEPKKNPMLLLNAFIKLSGRSDLKDRIHLLFLGNGILERELKMQSKETKGIHFIDFQNQTKMPLFYQACDIFCLPSAGPRETWGLAINEAMAAGKAIIASDKVGGATDLVKNGLNGYIFTSNDVEGLIQKLSLLLTQPHLCESFGDKSHSIIKDWNFKEQADQIIKTLDATN